MGYRTRSICKRCAADVRSGTLKVTLDSACYAAHDSNVQYTLHPLAPSYPLKISSTHITRLRFLAEPFRLAPVFLLYVSILGLHKIRKCFWLDVVVRSVGIWRSVSFDRRKKG